MVLGTTLVLAFITQMFNNFGEHLKNTTETFAGSLNASQELIAQNILEGMSSLEKEIKRGHQSGKLSLESLTTSLDKNLDSIHNAIMSVEEELSAGNENTAVNVALDTIAENINTGLSSVESEIRLGLSNLGNLNQNSLGVLSTAIRKAL